MVWAIAVSGLPDIAVIAGPTASGKTAVGIALAKALNGEIISADSRQIYRYMDIGTAKPTREEQAMVRHHVIDLVDPDGEYSAGQFARDAAAAIADIQARGKFPIVVGGAGLYLRALFDGFAPVPEVPIEIRQRLQEEALENLGALYTRLQAVDPLWAGTIQPADVQRIVRGLEVYEATGRTLSAFQGQPRQRVGTWRTQWFGLDWPRETLYDRINRRAVQMLDLGLIEEVKGLVARGYAGETNALNTFGYKECLQVLNGALSLDDALFAIQQHTRRYAKRQLTWFRAEKRIVWIDAEAGGSNREILKRLDSAQTPV